jgi:sortase (surface protein transpeptidase)
VTQRGCRATIAAALATAGSAMVVLGLGSPGPPQPPTAIIRPKANASTAGAQNRLTAAGTASTSSAIDETREQVRTAPAAPAGELIPALDRSVPVHLDIPEIGVHTGLIGLGRNPDGTVAVPPLTRHAPAGWYRDLASPGEVGPAVILGHVDSARDGPAVFYRLGALRSGDAISVVRADGSTAVFTVLSVTAYPKNDFPTRAVYGPLDHPGLRLVTCGGDFDAASGGYRANIVVYAALTGLRPALTERAAPK